MEQNPASHHTHALHPRVYMGVLLVALVAGLGLLNNYIHQTFTSEFLTQTAAVSGSSPVTSFSLTSGVSGSVPFTIGLALKKGDVPGVPQLSVPGSQAIVERRWNDGSVKFAIASGELTLAGGSPRTIDVTNGSTPSGKVLTVQDIAAAQPSASVSLGSYGTVNLSNLLSKPFSTWISGPEMVEAHYRSNVGSDPDLAVWFYVRLYKSGKVWVRTIVENGYLDTPSGQLAHSGDKNYVPNVSVGGKTVFNNGGTSMTHYAHNSWTAEGWIGVQDPQVTPHFDTAYLEATKLVPNYMNMQPSDAALSKLYQNYAPNENGDLTPYMANPGFQEDIGLLPNWDALYLTSGGDARAYRSVLANAAALTSYPVVWNSAKTQLPVRPSDYPYWTFYGDHQGGGRADSTNGHTWEPAHHPSEGYLAYLLTGDAYYLKVMEQNADSCYLYTSSGHGAGTSKIFYGEDRGQAWCDRTTGQLVGVGPKNDPIVSDYAALLANEASHFYSVMNTPGVSQLGYLYEYGLGGYDVGLSAPWQDNFWIATYGYISDLEPLADMSKWNAVRDHMYKAPVGLLGPAGADNYCYVNAGQYTIKISDGLSTDPTTWYQTWGQVYQATFGQPNTDCGNTLLGNSGGSPFYAATGYWGNLLPAIAYAVEDGAPGAAEAWNRLTSASNWGTLLHNQYSSGFNDTPVWGIVPRSVGQVTTPPPAPTTPNPTLTLSTSAGTITSGSSATLTWSSANASSCSASSGWVGGKLTNGNEAVSPTSDTTYVLTCTGSGGSVQRSVTISVTQSSSPAPPATPARLTLQSISTAEPFSQTNDCPKTLAEGDSCTVSITFTPTSVGAQNRSLTVKTNEGDQTVTLSGAGVTQAPTNPAPTLTLSAQSTSITSGNSTNLTWSSSNANSCTASVGWSGTKSTSGSEPISPTSNTTYILSCSGAGGSVSRSVTVNVAQPSSSTPPPSNLPTSVAGKTLSDCVSQLNAQGSGWCEMGQPISSVWPTRDQLGDAWVIVGPKSILIAWNGMAFDYADKLMYFAANGGHADYAGNEVYEFNLNTGVWTRLTDPAPLLRRYCGDPPKSGCSGLAEFPPYGQQVGGVYIPLEQDGPADGHTYDGQIYSTKTKTIFWRSGIYGNPGSEFHSNGELWEFNPSRTETRHGIAPLHWKLYRNPDGSIFHGLKGYPVSAELPNGNLLLGASGSGHTLDPTDPLGTLSSSLLISPGADYGDGNVIWDSGRNVAWFKPNYNQLLKENPDRTKQVFSVPTDVGNGMALRNGKLIFWDGKTKTYEYDPDANSWYQWDWTGKKPGTGYTHVYSKWVYLPNEDVFVGVTDESTGMLVYKHPSSGGTKLSLVSNSDSQVAAAESAVPEVPSDDNTGHNFFEALLNVIKKLFSSVVGTASGQSPTFVVSPDSLNFSSQTIGSKSAVQTVTITYVGEGGTLPPGLNNNTNANDNARNNVSNNNNQNNNANSNQSSNTTRGHSSGGVRVSLGENSGGGGSVSLGGSSGSSGGGGGGSAPRITRNLFSGSTGSDVRSLQQFLNQNPATRIANSGVGSPGNETDYYGTLTVDAVKKFQCLYGIVCSGTAYSTGYGVLGPKTRAKLAELSGGSVGSSVSITAPAPVTTPATTPSTNFYSSSALTRNLYIGSTGADVRHLQQILNRNGATQISVSGSGSPGNETTYYGSRTELAVRKFQCYYNIVCYGTAETTGYGVVGPKTREKLNQL